MRAFTLIELIVVVSIIVLMTAVGVPSFQQFGSKQELDQATDQAVAVIHEAQTLALAPSGGDISYSVTFTPPDQIVTSALVSSGSPRIINESKLPQSVSFSDNNEWIFPIADQGRLASDRSVTLIHKRLGITNAKVITGSAASGLIQIQ